MPEEVDIVIFSPLEEEIWVAEIWVSNEIWAIIYGEDPVSPRVEFWSRKNGAPFSIPYQDAIRWLETARMKLFGPE